MKLVVDVPEGNYKALKKMSGCGLGVYHNMILNGTPLSEELEKIKAKINLEDVDCQYEDDYVYSSGLQKAIEIIDTRIEELKGENNV